jgi:hypothetical protein
MADSLLAQDEVSTKGVNFSVVATAAPTVAVLPRRRRGCRRAAIASASEQLRHAPASGTRKTTLPVRASSTQGTVEGSLTVELSWRFE